MEILLTSIFLLSTWWGIFHLINCVQITTVLKHVRWWKGGKMSRLNDMMTVSRGEIHMVWTPVGTVFKISAPCGVLHRPSGAICIKHWLIRYLHNATKEMSCYLRYGTLVWQHHKEQASKHTPHVSTNIPSHALYSPNCWKENNTTTVYSAIENMHILINESWLTIVIGLSGYFCILYLLYCGFDFECLSCSSQSWYYNYHEPSCAAQQCLPISFKYMPDEALIIFLIYFLALKHSPSKRRGAGRTKIPSGSDGEGSHDRRTYQDPRSKRTISFTDEAPVTGLFLPSLHTSGLCGSVCRALVLWPFFIIWSYSP